MHPISILLFAIALVIGYMSMPIAAAGPPNEDHTTSIYFARSTNVHDSLSIQDNTPPPHDGLTGLSIAQRVSDKENFTSATIGCPPYLSGAPAEEVSASGRVKTPTQLLWKLPDC